MSELVTGEAVVLGLQPAKLASRAIAVAMDLAVYWGTYLIVSIAVVSATASLDQAAAAAVAVATLLLLVVGLPIAVETLSRGRSLGKAVCGLRVVRDDGGPIHFRHALVRGAVGAVEIQLSMGVIACIASLVSARGRRLGDVFAGTLVVRERVPAQYVQQPPPPPWMAGQLAGIDLSGLPEDLWLAIRQYLARMRQLDPEVSWTMAERLAGDVVARTGKAIPPGVPPAAYLATVVAERQTRDAQRVFGNGNAGQGRGPGGRGPSAPAPGTDATLGGGRSFFGGPISPVDPAGGSPAGPSYPAYPAGSTGFADPSGPAGSATPATPAGSAGPAVAEPGADAGAGTGIGTGTGFAPPA